MFSPAFAFFLLFIRNFGSACGSKLFWRQLFFRINRGEIVHLAAERFHFSDFGRALQTLALLRAVPSSGTNLLQARWPLRFIQAR